jgi:hypothetical protein
LNKEGLLGYHEYKLSKDILNELSKEKFNDWVYVFKNNMKGINKDIQYVGVGI